MAYTVEQLRDHLAACFAPDCCIIGNTTCQQIIDAIDEIVEDRDAKQRGYDDLHEMVGGNGDIWTKVDEILRERDRLRAALDQLRRDIDGYDTTFAYAEWIAAGKPGEFAAYCNTYMAQEGS